MFALIPAMLLVMLLFLMAQLHSFSRLALVLCIVPMGLIGIVGALLLSRRPLGLLTLIVTPALYNIFFHADERDGKRALA
jgi:multidrug efflux pump subunit AcrB